MALIKPFKGFRPISNKADKVSSPPYDVLNSAEARLMAKNNPHSFLNVIKPEISFGINDKATENVIHKQGSKNLQEFIKEGILVQDDKNCLYLYQIQMGEHIQTGIMAGISVEEYNKGLIKRHEFTRPEKEDDRTRHIEVTNANTGPVFLTYRNDGKFQNKVSEIKIHSPEVSFLAEDETVHSLWKIDSLNHITTIMSYFQSVPHLYIADGHHRAASASRVQKIRQLANPDHTGSEAYNYFLAVIFPDDEMQIMDYNRVVKDLNGLSEENFLEAIKDSFLLDPNPIPLKPLHPNTFSMYINKKWYRLEAKDHIKSDDPVDGLEASILQNYLLSNILGIGDPRTNKRIDFVGGVRGMKELERRCKTDCVVAFAIPPIKINQLFLVADSGKIMPPKSTWFEPKLRSGMVVRFIY